MLVHPYDSAVSEKEWRAWIAQSAKFGVLAVGAGAGQAPIFVPTHFVLSGDEIVIHLHKVNDALPHLETGAQVSLSIVGDYAFIPGPWRAKDPANLHDGVPTSYYAAVNFVCVPTVVSEPAEVAQIIQAHMSEFQPAGDYAVVDSVTAPYGPMMTIIRGVRLKIVSVDAKFKYDDHKPLAFRESVISKLQERDTHQDIGAAAQQARRLNEIGEWSKFRST
ncbi:MAG: FMN-binding negative transcriptional regulator [Microbacteriaceae bacterium]|nr:FMN-binding negative transcriptional regulator [Microbacteriaceae bacterium]